MPYSECRPVVHACEVQAARGDVPGFTGPAVHIEVVRGHARLILTWEAAALADRLAELVGLTRGA